MTEIRAAELKRGTAVMWRGERQVVEAVSPDQQNPEVVDIHFFGIAKWYSAPATMRVTATV